MVGKTFCTIKDMKAGEDYIISIPYGRWQYLLFFTSPRWYHCGVYGWNFDGYRGYLKNGDSVLICTGYRSTPKNRNMVFDSDIVREADKKAESLIKSLPYEEAETAVDDLLRETLEKLKVGE